MMTPLKWWWFWLQQTFHGTSMKPWRGGWKRGSIFLCPLVTLDLFLGQSYLYIKFINSDTFYTLHSMLHLLNIASAVVFMSMSSSLGCAAHTNCSSYQNWNKTLSTCNCSLQYKGEWICSRLAWGRWKCLLMLTYPSSLRRWRTTLALTSPTFAGTAA